MKNFAVMYNPTSLAISYKEPRYFIIGRCLSGSRHYSEYMPWCRIETEFDKYVAVVDYFGGGTVDIYSESGKMIKSETIFDFDF